MSRPTRSWARDSSNRTHPSSRLEILSRAVPWSSSLPSRPTSPSSTSSAPMPRATRIAGARSASPGRPPSRPGASSSSRRRSGPASASCPTLGWSSPPPSRSPPSSTSPSGPTPRPSRAATDAGLTGIGEAFAYGAPLAVCNVIEESLAPLIIGQDPSRIEYLMDLMQRGTMIYGRRGLAMFAISGVDLALWDLLGKARGAPLYELLGGATRPRLPVYASLMRYASPADVAAACRHFVSQGFGMLKLHQTDVASVKAAREAVGPTVELMLDVNCPWTPGEAIAMARAFEPYRLFWFEEPVWPPEDYAGLAP